MSFLTHLILKKSDSLSESFSGLLQVIQRDKEIKSRVAELLKLKPYQRRLLLNKWLEQLNNIKAPQKLMQSLTCLFDDSIAEKVETLISTYSFKNRYK